MAYYNNRRGYSTRSYGSRRSYKSSRKKKKYTSAETIAFKLGQQQRVKDSIASANKNTRVYEAFCKGFQGIPSKNSRKPLFSD